MQDVANIEPVHYGKQSRGINPGFFVACFSIFGALTLTFAVVCSEWTVLSMWSKEGLWVVSRGLLRTCVTLLVHDPHKEKAQKFCEKTKQVPTSVAEILVMATLIASLIVSIFIFFWCFYLGFQRWMKQKIFLRIGFGLVCLGTVTTITMEIFASRRQIPVNSATNFGVAHHGSCYFLAWSGIALIDIAALTCIMALITAWR